MPGRVLGYGEGALLVEVDTLHHALDLHDRVTGRDRPPGLADAVLGACSVLLVARTPADLRHLRDTAERLLRVPTSPDPHPQRGDGSAPAEVRIAVHYDGEDLDAVARHTGLGRDEVVAAHTGTPWLVGFAGFAPGFAYLVDGDPRLRVPRRDTPRTRVPAGAVGLADGFSGIYPRASPGGWQLIGHTDAALWDLGRQHPALLRPGQRVRFVEVGS